MKGCLGGVLVFVAVFLVVMSVYPRVLMGAMRALEPGPRKHYYMIYPGPPVARIRVLFVGLLLGGTGLWLLSGSDRRGK